MGVAALVCGIAGLVFCWTVVGGLVVGGLGVVFGILALRRSRRTGAPNRGLGIAGIVVGALGVVGGAVMLALVLAVVTSDSFQDDFRSFKNYTECIQEAQTPEEEQQCEDRFDRELREN
jgi:hypothetical protein